MGVSWLGTLRIISRENLCNCRLPRSTCGLLGCSPLDRTKSRRREGVPRVVLLRPVTRGSLRWEFQTDDVRDPLSLIGRSNDHCNNLHFICSLEANIITTCFMWDADHAAQTLGRFEFMKRRLLKGWSKPYMNIVCLSSNESLRTVQWSGVRRETENLRESSSAIQNN